MAKKNDWEKKKLKRTFDLIKITWTDLFTASSSNAVRLIAIGNHFYSSLQWLLCRYLNL